MIYSSKGSRETTRTRNLRERLDDRPQEYRTTNVSDKTSGSDGVQVQDVSLCRQISRLQLDKPIYPHSTQSTVPELVNMCFNGRVFMGRVWTVDKCLWRLVH